jgi:cytochrome c-type biogenesis protein CcmH/NrfG
MSPVTSPTTEFERNARVVLEHGIERIDGRMRSRLNQARQQALEAAAGGRQRPWWRSSALMPAGAVAAASLLAVMLWYHEPAVRQGPLPESHVSAVEDMDLLADADGVDLIEGWDGPFYEWAADQSDANTQSDS